MLRLSYVNTETSQMNEVQATKTHECLTPKRQANPNRPASAPKTRGNGRAAAHMSPLQAPTSLFVLSFVSAVNSALSARTSQNSFIIRNIATWFIRRRAQSDGDELHCTALTSLEFRSVHFRRFIHALTGHAAAVPDQNTAPIRQTSHASHGTSQVHD